MPYATRRAYAGAAATCTLSAAIASDASTASLTGTVSGWPDTANGPFYMVIDPGLATEEKVLVGSRSSTSLSTVSRGVDGTQASAHSTGAVCYPVFTAVDADQANKVVSTLTTKGDLLVTDGTVLNRLAVGTAKHVLVATTGATNGVSWTQIDADGIATGAVTSDKILDGTIVNTDINASAGIVDTKLATIATAGKVSNSATTATADAGNNTIVARGATGNFAAGTITANLTGNVTGDVTGTASNASKIGNRTVFVQSATPTALATNDIWFQTA
jgi:hypothetical protein